MIIEIASFTGSIADIVTSLGLLVVFLDWVRHKTKPIRYSWDLDKRIKNNQFISMKEYRDLLEKMEKGKRVSKIQKKYLQEMSEMYSKQIERFQQMSKQISKEWQKTFNSINKKMKKHVKEINDKPQ